MRNAIPSAVYVMVTTDGAVKIGRSRDPEARRHAVEWSGPGRLALAYATPVRDDGSYVESEVHRSLSDRRLNGEWFSVTPEDAVSAVKAAEAAIDARRAVWVPPRRRPRVADSGDKAMMTPIPVRFPAPMRTEIEKIRDGRMDQPELSAVIRELVAEALTARGKRK
jgi:hypothetical protein